MCCGWQEIEFGRVKGKKLVTRYDKIKNASFWNMALKKMAKACREESSEVFNYHNMGGYWLLLQKAWSLKELV